MAQSSQGSRDKLQLNLLMRKQATSQERAQQAEEAPSTEMQINSSTALLVCWLVGCYWLVVVFCSEDFAHCQLQSRFKSLTGSRTLACAREPYELNRGAHEPRPVSLVDVLVHGVADDVDGALVRIRVRLKCVQPWGLGSPGIPQHKNNTFWQEINTFGVKRSCINSGNFPNIPVMTNYYFLALYTQKVTVSTPSKLSQHTQKRVSTPPKTGLNTPKMGLNTPKMGVNTSKMGLNTSHLQNGSHNTSSLNRADHSTFHC